jgi:hypothetical protein
MQGNVSLRADQQNLCGELEFYTKRFFFTKAQLYISVKS